MLSFQNAIIYNKGNIFFAYLKYIAIKITFLLQYILNMRKKTYDVKSDYIFIIFIVIFQKNVRGNRINEFMAEFM